MFTARAAASKFHFKARLRLLERGTPVRISDRSPSDEVRHSFAFLVSQTWAAAAKRAYDGQPNGRERLARLLQRTLAGSEGG